MADNKSSPSGPTERHQDPIAPLTFLDNNSSAPSAAKDQSQILREGHITLRWQPDPRADGYRVIDHSGAVIYEGRMARGFVSGLPDGEYEFTAVSVGQDLETIEKSQEPLRVVVQHHSLETAGLIFSVGALVVLILFGVLVAGGRRGLSND